MKRIRLVVYFGVGCAENEERRWFVIVVCVRKTTLVQIDALLTLIDPPHLSTYTQQNQ